ncbi:aspartate/glutamate racemase family protein [Aestuariivirga sp.]|uniref:aspartate/glutamate racemase family protein n=1 Tax=Aestuariivirga sp. TaxID=2650926 RepID=UPI003BAD82BA
MKKLAFIHTAPWHADRFRALAQQKLPGWSSYAVVDESLLLDTIERGEVASRTVQRLAGYIFAAADAGAEAVVVTCSTLGGAVDAMRPITPVPLFRIDRGMAKVAAGQARRIGVLATLPTTLRPTAALLADEAVAAGAKCEISHFLCEGAFAKLRDGDRTGHDESVREGFARLAVGVDLIVLAQASMADAIGGAVQCPYLTNPEIGMEHVAQQLGASRSA